MPAFATLGDLKKHLNKTTSADDDELQDVLDAASERVESLIGTTFDAVAATERVAANGGTVVLSRRPIVGNVTINNGDVTGFTYNREAGLLYDVHPGWVYPLTVTYTAGGSTVPASVTLATVIIAAHLWETQRGTTLSPLSQQDVDATGSFAGAGFAIPNRARELLEPFIRGSQVA